MYTIYEYNVPYIIVEEINRHYIQYVLDGCDELRAGDIIEFRPDYHGGGPWAMDYPISIEVHVTGNMLDGTKKRDKTYAGAVRRLSLDIIFDDGFGEKAAWRILEPRQAEAFFAGIPLEDVLGKNRPPEKRR